MVKIKFTPFVLFLILLVVLVISVLFGYKNKIFEGATSNKAESYKEVAKMGDVTVSVDKNSGSILIQNSADSSALVIDSTGREEDATEGLTTRVDSPDDVSAFVYEDDNLIMPYVNYAEDIYMMVIDRKGKKAVASYTYAKGKENVDVSIKDKPMVFKNMTKKKSKSNTSGNKVSMSTDIDIDMDKNKFKKDGDWMDVRTKNSSPQIIPSADGSIVISMEGTMSTSNYVVFVLYMLNNVINMDPVIIKYDSKHSKDKDSNGKGSKIDMSKYVPKSWLNPNGCPKCTGKGDCSNCGSPGSSSTPSPSGSPASGSPASGSPGSRPGFGSNLVNQSAGVANNAIGGATALGLGATLGATVLGASAVGGATSVGNNAIRGATGLGTSAIGGAAGLGNNAIGGVAGLGNNAIGGATRLGQGVTNVAGKTVGTAGNVLNNTLGTAGGVVNNAVNKLTGLAAGLGTGTKDLLQSGNRTNLQQVQAMQGQGQLAQGQNAQGQVIQGAPCQSMYGQMINYQPGGQQYAGYQFANPMLLPYPGGQTQTSNFVAPQAGTNQGKGGNYFN